MVKNVLNRQSNFNNRIDAKALEIEFENFRNYINKITKELLPAQEEKLDAVNSNLNAFVYGNPVIMNEQIYYGYRYYPVIKEFTVDNVDSGNDVLVYEINTGDWLMEVDVNVQTAFDAPTGFYMKDTGIYLIQSENIDLTVIQPNYFPIRKEYTTDDSIYFKMEGVITAGVMKIMLVILKKTDFSSNQAISVL